MLKHLTGKKKVDEDKLSVIDAQNRIIERYALFGCRCIALLYCVLEDKMPKNEARYEKSKLERWFHEIGWKYDMTIKPEVYRVLGCSLEDIMKDLGLDPPSDK